ncbi:MAG: hypothetical protein LH616_03160 [Ilumatobacteraceae bacterium]|nr:hypothetical protein [Ilumatobacteraceae bacterium]
MTNNKTNQKPTAAKSGNRNEPATNKELTIRWRYWQDNGLPVDIESRLAGLGTHTTSAAARVAEQAEQIATHLVRRTPIDAMDRFLNESDDWAERTDRFATVRTLEKLTSFTRAGTSRLDGGRTRDRGPTARPCPSAQQQKHQTYAADPVVAARR